MIPLNAAESQRARPSKAVLILGVGAGIGFVGGALYGGTLGSLLGLALGIFLAELVLIALMGRRMRVLAASWPALIGFCILAILGYRLGGQETTWTALPMVGTAALALATAWVMAAWKRRRPVQV